MTRVVIDTNVLISALLTEHGAEATVLSFIESGRVLWCVTDQVLTEYREVISRPKFRAVRAERVRGVLITLSKATIFTGGATITESPDEPDNRFLECAEAAQADYLVTGNTRHFPKRWKNTLIINARQFVKALK